MKRLFFVVIASTALTVAAQQRVFVSAAGGDDANNCSIPAPCRSFAKAMTVVSTGGEVLALDSGGYGPVTIGRSVSIVAPPGVEGSITQNLAGQNAITVTAGSGIVSLRGLSIFGVNVANDGILAIQAGALTVESCHIADFSSSGIELTVNALTRLTVRDSTLSDNAGNGIVTTGASSDEARLIVDHCRVDNNSIGLNVMEGSNAVISSSTLSANASRGIEVQTHASGQNADLDIDTCVIAQNGVGIYAWSNLTTGSDVVRVARSVIVQNTIGLATGDPAAHLWSRGDNTLTGNAAFDGAFTDFFTPH